MLKQFIAAGLCFFFSLRVFAQQHDTTNVNELLDLSLEELMNIKVVTASGYLQTASEAPSTIIVITAKQIAERGYEQLEDALRDVPGIDMIHINGYAPTLIYFRGMYGAENLRALLMIDGIAENNILGSNDMAGPAYSLHHIERIEIIWGPVSALYGANAFGGVINLITKKGADMNGFHYELGYGSFNTMFHKMNLGLRKSKFEFTAAGTLYSTDGPRFTNRDPNYSASYVDRAFSINTSISYHGKRSKTTLGFRNYRTPMGWGTYSNSPSMYLRLPPPGNQNMGVIGILQRDFRGERAGLDLSELLTGYGEYSINFSNKLQMLARAVYRETGVDEKSFVYVTTDGRRMIRVPIATWSSRVSGEVNLNFALTDQHRFSAGVQYFQDNVEQGSRGVTIDMNTIYLVDGRDTVLNLNSTFLPRKYDIRNNFGSFLQYTLNTTWLGKTNFTLGARYDNNSYFGDAFSPRISVVNRPNDRFTFKLHYGRAFRAPTNLEIYQTPPNSGFQLKQEKIKTYEFNVIYTPLKKLKLQLNGFRNELRDVIILGNLSGFTADKNPGVFEINGAELIAEMIINKIVSGYFNFTFQDANGINLATGVSGKLPAVARFKANAGILVQAEELFTVNLSGNWVGERPVQRTNPYGPVKGYFLANVNIRTRKLFKDRITASIAVHNLFNVKWFDPGFRTADGNLYATVLEQPGINAMFKVGIDL